MYRRDDEQVGECDQKKFELVGRFLIFVMEDGLREQSAGPAAEEVDGEQGGFGRAPFALPGFGFIDGVDDEAGDACDEIHRGDQYVHLMGECEDDDACQKNQCDH